MNNEFSRVLVLLTTICITKRYPCGTLKWKFHSLGATPGKKNPTANNLIPIFSAPVLSAGRNNEKLVKRNKALLK